MRHLMAMVAASAATVANAQVTLYSTKASFDANSNAVITVTFEEPEWDAFVGGGPAVNSSNSVTFDASPGAVANLFVAPAGQSNFGFPPQSRVLTESGNEHIDLIFDEVTFAAGFEFYANGSDPATFIVTLTNGATTTFTNPQAPDSLGYVGFVSSTLPIERVNWLASGGAAINTGIDNVATDYGVCFADCNNDGVLNILDFVCFQAAFVANSPAADCDDSGALNVLDFTCYQAAFEAGCL